MLGKAITKLWSIKVEFQLYFDSEKSPSQPASYTEHEQVENGASQHSPYYGPKVAHGAELHHL